MRTFGTTLGTTGRTRVGVLTLLAAFALACGGGGSSGGGGTSGSSVADTGGGDSSGSNQNSGGDSGSSGGDTGSGSSGGGTAPVIAGFDFSLEQGDFWEYRWDSYSLSGSAYGSSSEYDMGRLRITLGSPVTIEGLTTYTLEVEGSSDVRPRWTHIALEGNQFLGSTDGSSLSAIFDAQNGYWPGGGFFADFGSDSLTEATAGQIDNDYISEQAYVAGAAGSQSQCEYYPGYGTICGSDDASSWTRNDYFMPGLGPVGYYYSASLSFGGSFPSYHVSKDNVGLVLSSLQGDSVNYDLEEEPNDASGAAQTLTLNRSLVGNVMQGATGEGLDIDFADGSTVRFQFHDWYQFTLPQSDLTMGVYISLDFAGSDPDTDLDLFLFDSSMTQLLGSSTADNAASGFQTEGINGSLGTGTYYIGVSAWNTDSSVDHGNVEYTLKVQYTSPSSLLGGSFDQFTPEPVLDGRELVLRQ